MNEEERIRNINRLIIRYLQGDISSEEQRQLEQWRNEEEENERLFQKLSQLQLTKDYQRYRWAKQADSQTKLLRKVSEHKHYLFPVWLRYVAIVCVLFAVGYYITNYVDKSEPPVVAEKVIKPGMSKAILKLADGKEVFLGQKGNSNKEVLDDYGISEMDSMLIYDKKAAIEEFHILEVPRGGEYTLRLEDGSMIWVNSESVVKFPVRFGKMERRIYLLKGEVYLEVARDENRPFYVEASQLTVNVLGTGFNVSNYDNESQINVTLAHGSVRVLKEDAEIMLKPNEQVVLDKNTDILQVRQVDAGRVCAWRTGCFYFEGMSLADLTERLARWFDCEFFFTSEELKKLTFSGAFKKYEDINYILSIIEATTNIKMEINSKTVVISY